jgi:hypothetical protein
VAERAVERGGASILSRVSQIFIWQSVGQGDEATERFDTVVRRQTGFYNELLSNGCTSKVARVGSIFIGQIGSDLGIAPWSSWWEEDGWGLAWSGVCEDYLGKAPRGQQARRLVRDIIDQPGRLVDLTGSFAACAWDTAMGVVAVMTAATQAQVLWQTDGPDGTAIGSRARPLLDLVGREPELDEVQAGVVLAYQYLHGDGSLFKHVRRLSARRHVLLRQDHQPSDVVYVSLGDYLGKPEVMTLSEATQTCAERLADRTARQLRFSRNPVLYLTGGTDSRCIAAALSHSSFAGPTATDGDRSSADVRTGAKVARTLGWDHVATGHTMADADLLARLETSLHRARMRIRLSEGAETISAALLDPDFFSREAHQSAAVVQAFIGLHAGLEKAKTSFTPERRNRFVGPHLRRHREVVDRFETVSCDIAAELDRLDAPLSRWSDLYYWQFRGLRWGQDIMLTQDLFAWWWTPLFDRVIIRTGWHLPEEDRHSLRFIQGIIARSHPALARLPYAGDVSPPSARIRRAARKVQRRAVALSPWSHPHTPVAEAWKAALYRDPDPVWQQWVDERYVRQAIRTGRSRQLLWSILTVQLFVETHLGGGAPGACA